MRSLARSTTAALGALALGVSSGPALADSPWLNYDSSEALSTYGGDWSPSAIESILYVDDEWDRIVGVVKVGGTIEILDEDDKVIASLEWYGAGDCFIATVGETTLEVQDEDEAPGAQIVQVDTSGYFGSGWIWLDLSAKEVENSLDSLFLSAEEEALLAALAAAAANASFFN